jgi:transcriptional regulator with XRE-family HTH domain
MPASEPIPNHHLANLREGRSMSQQEVADWLNAKAEDETGRRDSVTFTTVSRWERGTVSRPGPARRRRLAELYGVTVSDLGWDRQRLIPTDSSPTNDDLPLAPSLDPAPQHLDQDVARSQEEWRLIRRGLNEHRAGLTEIGARLHVSVPRVGSTSLITCDRWMPVEPVDMVGIKLDWVDEPPPPELDGTERQTSSVRPLVSPKQRYRRYTHAIRDLVRPTLFENRLSYRLLDVDFEGSGQLTFGPTTYFDMLDVCEAAAHELATAHLRPADNAGSTSTEFHKASWRRQPFRKLIGDPFNLARRPLLPSIITLTIRRSAEGATFILHRRDSGQVAVAGSLLHVIPTGVFQPSSISPTIRAHDFDLWRNTMREYSEEFLGNLEHEGNASGPLDYDGIEPFRSLNQARRDGQLRAYCFGIGLDPLTLCGEILTAVVIDDNVFDDVFRDLVETNNEGEIVLGDPGSRLGPGIAFNQDNVTRLIDSGRMAPSGAACLDFAWEHRRLLLGE